MERISHDSYFSEASEEDKTQRENTNQSLNKGNTDALDAWIQTHEEYPYPNKSEVKELAARSGLSHKQVRVWFTNYRYRKFTPETSCISKIKHAINSKSIKASNEKAKSNAVKEMSSYYLSKYFCACGTQYRNENSENWSEMIRAIEFLKKANYCTCSIDPYQCGV